MHALSKFCTNYCISLQYRAPSFQLNQALCLCTDHRINRQNHQAPRFKKIRSTLLTQVTYTLRLTSSPTRNLPASLISALLVLSSPATAAPSSQLQQVATTREHSRSSIIIVALHPVADSQLQHFILPCSSSIALEHPSSDPPSPSAMTTSAVLSLQYHVTP